jgi:hypothetical protein
MLGGAKAAKEMRRNIILVKAAGQNYKYTFIHSRLQPIVHFIALKRTRDDTQEAAMGNILSR